MKRALVLNASYEPLSIVSARRAVVLVLDQKADMVERSDDVLRSERHRLEVPSVVRLRYFVKLPYERRCSLSRRGVFARDGHRCQYCGGRAESIDHIHPRSKGGPHTWENVVAACRRCNTNKRDRFLNETSMALRSAPREPPRNSWLRFAVPSVPAQWEPYLDPTESLSQSA